MPMEKNGKKKPYSNENNAKVLKAKGKPKVMAKKKPMKKKKKSGYA